MTLSLDFSYLRTGYRTGAFSPHEVFSELLATIAARGDDSVWINRLSDAQVMAYVTALAGRDPATLPLYGLPFAIKDNIDLADCPTTAACPAYAYTPTTSATAVQKLLDAGAIPLGKTNLDQFATGLVGTRSPYGVPVNPFDSTRIPGGSSSGSAVAVAAGLASFSLGTDTAGSGRVPAGFNNLFGLKPTRGLVSTRGLVPACRSLDCISVFALTLSDAQDVLAVMQGFDTDDPFSRPARWVNGPLRQTLGIPRPEQLEFFGDTAYARCFETLLTQLSVQGITLIEIDFTPFQEAARLLYESAWLAERYAAVGAFMQDHPQALHPVTQAVISRGLEPSAVDAFRGYYRLKELRRQVAPLWADMDALLTPTAATHYTLSEVAAEPLLLNSRLGYYTNYMNLLDLSGLAVPGGWTAAGLPFGVTLVGPAFAEARLGALAAPIQTAVC